MFTKKLTAFFLDILEVVVFSIAIFLFVYLLVLQPHKIKGDSMQPNFPDGEYLITDKLTYRFREPQRGEVIVFEAPGGAGEEFIKRIIGLPNEKVGLKDGKVYINERVLDEPYLSETLETGGSTFLKNGEEVSVPEGHYLVLGDNRPASSDSRTWGFVSKDKITGRGWVVYWPPQSAGFIKKVVYSLASS
ncbi:signal peptidase I [Candidatus Woesebacteria bacterium RIFCSPLOWO2_01_FULL_39_61]|uniref:Signal peptidase I n=1 Tax=Candidatus Woesebacteria bacterium RIFCSPHIGHO2_02_FULL_39_13 TaxID=1802505 RepID=A0A1F7Z0P8_9BACT|nr:MAG: signal peptidase I [Candidatus Woesebacteria bacterium RIFCSPHIGHO2_01_FULL_39_95]OGM33024.1 MAG: signal peptidase I [Candidatus Woesebacteria bacterium RIFCSPHIGHO2_02_FULL_39_13]OGM37883.1 MAG: signal peptidase I [Candidatus Woesebacteria bacterium RIFCSPHIGHO2_12_FULL_40_20]OGM66456.1 MAG: signal peptidase I [Candidatus Woesebacteria bacterium RIFCSPLOWO2_01_FULL_39_61]OGM74819.1 MAG: signal peptidase I [Candidatus Woesebacteria bacterium RIFCSPLOWO2_12_FULL_39_9]